ncbi:MAG: hypothetical protein H6737_22700 [Alphaproteobacteria bacterium]|nr:hypothetical protein [Alphaproteobacteria bacterium]
MLFLFAVAVAAPTQIDYASFPNTNGLTLNGDANYNSGSAAIDVTDSANRDKGSVFYSTPIDWGADYSLRTHFVFDINGGSGGAHGMAFVMHDDSQGASAVGSDEWSTAYDGISPSVFVEIDTYDEGTDDPNGNHLGIGFNGDTNTVTEWTGSPTDFNNGNNQHLWVEYSQQSQLLEVYWATSASKPASPQLTYTVDVLTRLGTTFYVGFTGGSGPTSGNYDNEHQVKSWQLDADVDADDDGRLAFEDPCDLDPASPLTDTDSDGLFGLCDACPNVSPNDGDGDGALACGATPDCDDANPAVRPGAAEVTCNGVDDDCDAGTVDAPDVDGDGSNICPVGGIDCDDNDPLRYPGKPEIFCNGIDDDCGTVADNVDQDNDGAFTCDVQPDCQDNNPAIHPGQNEITCNGLDDDCDPATLDGPDGDADGVATCVDCDDANPDNFPGNVETCDSADNDCDGVADNGLSFSNYFVDGDGDLFGAGAGMSACADPGSGFSTLNTDCDDTADNVYPGAMELCDGLDNDCNGFGINGPGSEADQDNDGYRICDGDCLDTVFAANPGAAEICDGIDNDCNGSADYPGGENDADGDGFRACDDCDDGTGVTYPGAAEVCDAEDNDCNGQVDDGLTFVDYFADGDADGYGAGAAENRCEQIPGWVPTAGDCDDAVAGTHPGATEVCDGVDNDCVGGIDDGIQNANYYEDADGDGYGDPFSTPVNDCQPPTATSVANNGDCDDSDPDVNPASPEVCDGIDNDCVGGVDDGLTFELWYTDVDGDGYGDPNSTPISSCSEVPGRVTDATDCDPALVFTHPGAPEICDDLDNDCNGVVDEGLPTDRFYYDADLDGFGDPGVYVDDCSIQAGYRTIGGDCDDVDPLINPDATEVCDGIDNDCTGVADDGIPSFPYYADQDDDGYGAGAVVDTDCFVPGGYSLSSADCNDGNDAIYPGAIEQCDQLDNNCNGIVDDNVATVDWYPDLDNDGFGSGTPVASCAEPTPTTEWAPNALDCNDANAAVNPTADEICDALDNDCDGLANGQDPDLVAPLYYPDNDGDGFGSETALGAAYCSPPTDFVLSSNDCDDDDLNVNIAAPENCPDGIDNDCDGLVDVDDPDYTPDQLTYWYDQDGDGYGTPALTVQACPGLQPLGYVPSTAGFDCNDAEYFVNAGAAEACDGLDNDCDGVLDDGLPTQPFYPDLDLDTYGDANAVPLELCGDFVPAALGLVQTTGDCDDAEALVFPGATEVCDGIDNNCVGGIDEGLLGIFWRDDDGDGYGDADDAPVEACLDAPPPSTVLDPTDCDDTNENVNPGAEELCGNGIDDDCDGEATEGILYYPDFDGDGHAEAGHPGTDSCTPISGHLTESGDDCDDSDASRFDDCDAAPTKTGCNCDGGAGSPVPWAFVGLFLLGLRRRAA